MATGRKIGKTGGAGLFYGWIIVIAGTILWTAASAVLNSFGVFFKPLAGDFGWDRSTTSLVQSVYFVLNGLSAIFWGIVADRFGPGKTIGVCGSILSLGLLLTSRASTLWQMYLTYSFMTGVGTGGIVVTVTTTAARWFVQRRGLALGIVACGAGLGALFGPPLAARLIAAFGWSQSYFILGIAAGSILLTGACFMRRSPEEMGLLPYGIATKAETVASNLGKSAYNRDLSPTPLPEVIRTRALWILATIVFLFNVCNQMVMVHLVNYATDLGIDPFAAATLMSIIGISSITGRVVMGSASDRIGNLNTFALSCLGIVPSLAWLALSHEIWMLGLFTIVYGFSFGAEVPQQTALIGKFFGLRAVVVGILAATNGLGGALGSWMGGWVYDATNSYQIAFIIAGAGVLFALCGIIVLKNRDTRQLPDARKQGRASI